MSNWGKDWLFILIKSLTRSEKRQFTLYVNRLQNNADAKFISLFNAMDKMEEYDEQVILKQKITSKQQLSNLKANLYKAILASLRMNPSKKNVRIQIREQLDFATILYQKGLHKQGLKILDKAKQIALDVEEKSLALEIIELEKVIESQYITRSITGRADELIAQSNDLIIQNYYATKLSNLSLKFYNEMLTSGYAKSEEDKQELITRFSDQLLDIDVKVLNFREKLWYFKAHVWLCFLIQDYHNAYKYAKLWVTLFYEHPKMIQSHPIWYLKGNSYLFKILLLFKSVDKYIYWNSKLEEQLALESFPQSMNIDSQRFLLQFSNKLNIEFIQQTYNGSLLFVKQLQRGINEYRNMIDEHHFHILYFKVASLYFGYKKYDDSLAYTERILNKSDYSVQEDLLFHTRILSLMAQYESGKDQHYEDFIKANRALMKKMKNKTQIHDTFMSLFEGLLGASVKDQKLVLERFVKETEELYTNRFYVRSILYIDVLNWAKKKIA
ncbi:hypothetical protein HX045_03405 [Myroides odoratimimus]|uniref:Tetratricopeptide repeat protein n=1 Tax=Myroides odoratimimus CCUG 10230 TaxID=883150 RepID=A0ABP2NGD2_9FLAO|nr:MULTISPECIES: hypothetical protein [Myroides]AJA69273.1 hypothetical protein MYRA21_2143 [Myroides sp. A21]EHO12011.1 hypothetical protein HMPREF9712_00258 [Myroides odoratimimus CCUG 10230]EHO13213.1 hypothetical protein HMPREF9714_01047 [Myroides odoratimimus CCUG 12901]MCA4792103.1 hypothetical protein [Myroides odoratimimus]MCA4806694.1 hypothetical protein [Myroides odoratimimus]